MNKYIIIGIVLVAIIGAGIVFKSMSGKFSCAPEDGTDVVMTIVSKKLQWVYEPENITVNQCDKIKLTVINEDNFDHGFAIDAFGISQRLPAGGTIKVDFVASQSGTFPFYCSVSCGNSNDATFDLPEGKVQAGKYAGETRGHFDHLGQFIVRMIENMTNSP